MELPSPPPSPPPPPSTGRRGFNAAAGRRPDKPSYQQLEMLTEFLETHRQLAASSYLRAPDARRRSDRLWATVAVQLNALGGSVRDGHGWKKYWTDKKSYLKRQASIRLQSARRTGGGVDALPPVSALDLRMQALLGTSFGRGDGTEVDPFPRSQDTAVESAQGAVEPAQASTSRMEVEEVTAEEIGHTLVEETQWVEELQEQRISPDPLLPEPPVEPLTPPARFAENGVNPAPRNVQQNPEHTPQRRQNERPQPRRRRQPMSALRREREWLQDIESQRLALERERIALERERITMERERAERQERFQEQLLERMDAMFTRLANALLIRHEH